MKNFYENNKKLLWSMIATVCIAVCAIVVYSVYNANIADDDVKESKTAQTMSDQFSAEDEQVVETPQPATLEAVTLKAVTQEVVTKEAVTLEAVTTQAVTTQAVSSQAATAKPSEKPKESKEPKPSATPKPKNSATPKPKASATPTPKPKTSKKPKKNTSTVITPDIDTSKIAKNVPYPYQIKVNKKKNCVTVYAMDTSGKYSIPVKAMVCSTGRATPLGKYNTKAKYVWKALNGGVWGQYSTRIVGGILFHSVPYRTAKKDTLKNSYYNKLGTTASAGCVRLTTKDAKWIYDNCPLKTPVVIYSSSDPGPLGKPSAIKVPKSNKWDPTDPDKKNPWIKKKPEIKGVKNKTIERGTKFDPLAGVKALDFDGDNITKGLNVTSNVNTNKVGTYKVQYHIEDLTGKTAEASCTITVRDTKAPTFSNVKNKIQGLKKNEITRARLLKGITVKDNNQSYNINRVEVQIPKLVDGNNTVIYKAKDDYGNVATAKTTVYCDFTKPSITKKGSAVDVISLNQKVDSNYILGRIKVSDKSSVKTKYTLKEEDWGYKITYTATDSYGNKATYSDRIKYVKYEFEGAQTLYVENISDENRLKEDLRLIDSFGNSMELPNDVEISVDTEDNKCYDVTYTYKYSSPLGRKTITFDRVVYIQGQ